MSRQLSMPYQVGWDIVHECNLRCRHCYFSAQQLSDKRSLGRDEAVDFVRYLGEKRVFHLSLAGGEPMVFPHLEDVIAEATRQRIVVALSTNATLLSEARADALWRAGLRSMQVSLDGSSAQINDAIRGSGTFERTLTGLKVAVAHGFEVLIAVVITKINADDIGNVVELASRMGASGVKVQTLIDSGLGQANRDELEVDESSLIAYIESLWELKKEYSSKLKMLLPLVPTVVDRAKDEPEHYYRDLKCHGCQPGLSTIRIDNLGGGPCMRCPSIRRSSGRQRPRTTAREYLA